MRPIKVEGLDIVKSDTSSELGLFERRTDGAHGRLRSATTHAVDSAIHDICAGSGTCQHRSHSHTGGVMGVDVNGEIGVSLSDGSHQHGSSLGLQQTGHVLDGQDVDSLSDELVDKVEVVLQRVFGLLGVGDITGVAHNGLDDTSSLLGSIDSKLHVFNVVERVEHSENVESVFNSFLAEVVDGVVGVRSVTNRVGTSYKGLKRNVGNQLSQGSKSLPRVFVKESHRDIESSSTPAFQGVGIRQGVTGLLGNVGHIDGS